MKNIIKSNSNGSGISTLPLVDLETYIHVYEAGTNNKLSNEQLGERGIQYSYFTVEANYSKSGVLWADQSLFGSIAGNSDFNATEVEHDKNYWQANSVINLDTSDFEQRDSAVEDGYYLYLSPVDINKLNQFRDIEIIIDIDLNGSNILGFDSFALSGLKNIKEINITSDTDKTFKLQTQCLDKTNFSVSNIKTSNVDLIDNTGGAL